MSDISWQMLSSKHPKTLSWMLSARMFVITGQCVMSHVPSLTCSGLCCAHVLDSPCAPGCAHDDDLLAPGCPDDLLTTPGDQLPRPGPLGLVDDDGLLAAHRGHLHARPQGLDTGLAAHGDQVGAQGPHLGGAHTRLVDH